jgi:alkylation response protein AidB-like acyl-CoA dehydrogenase
MDVITPEIPASYDGYRQQLKAFVAEHRPELGWKQRTGLRAPETAEDVTVLRAWAAAIYDAGYVSAQYTEAETDPFEQRILAEELSRTGVPYILGNPLVAGALKLFGTPEQKATYLTAIARGDHIWTQLFSEPNAGSDLTGLQTRGILDGDDYVIEGQKVWSTWAQFADYGYLLARTEGEGSKGITAFILDMHSPGVDTRPLREITGTTDFCEVFLDEVRVPKANIIGQPGQGWMVANASLAQERGGVGGGGTGDTLHGLVQTARAHRRGGRPAIDDHGVRQQIGGLAARSRIQKYLGYTVATRGIKGESTMADGPSTKIWFSELNLEIAEAALGLQGARSLLTEGDPGGYLDGRWQDSFLYARAWTIAGGSSEIMRNLIAERHLQLPREPRGK